MSLLSLEFVALASVLVLWVRFVRGWLRLAGFLAGSAYYAFSHLGPVGSATTAAFLMLGYALALIVRERPQFTAAAVGLLVAAFVYLRGYDLVVACFRRGLEFGARDRRPELSALQEWSTCRGLGRWRAAPPRLLVLHRLLPQLHDVSAWTDSAVPELCRISGKGASIRSRRIWRSHLDAVNRILRGYLKKWVFADLLVGLALLPGESIDRHGAPVGAAGAWFFYLYLYFDFSGYCDIVIGIGRLMGIAPPENFWLPFLSPNIAQYWLRVHRSLTEWLTDYVFHPVYTGAATLRSHARPSSRRAERRHRHDDDRRRGVARDDAVVPAVWVRPRVLSGRVSHA